MSDIEKVINYLSTFKTMAISGHSILEYYDLDEDCCPMFIFDDREEFLQVARTFNSTLDEDQCLFNIGDILVIYISDIDTSKLRGRTCIGGLFTLTEFYNNSIKLALDCTLKTLHNKAIDLGLIYPLTITKHI